MKPQAILHELMRADGWPLEALRAAGRRRSQMVPLFIEQVEKYLRADTTQYDNDAPLFFVFHLLGDWKEVSAYRPFARLLRCPSEAIDAAIAEGITETVHRVMAAVFDGDPLPIYNIILDEGADEHVRARMCETLAILVMQGKLDRDAASAFLRDCWISLQPRDGCFVWHGWQSAIALLGLVELRGMVRDAFERKIVDRRWLQFRDFERDLEQAVRSPATAWQSRIGENLTPFGDITDELSGWYGLSDQNERCLNGEREELLPAAEPIRNPMRGVGRNDPCPCHSGKKYKKCCLN